jgi:hypothetical protein
MRAAGATAADDAVSGAEFRALSAQAVSDPAARTRLLQVKTVDGRAVDIPAALADGDDAAVAARLRVLAGSGGGSTAAPTPAAARDAARQVLRDRKFHESRVPRPFRGVLHWLGDRLAPIGRPIARLWNALLGRTLGRIVVVVVVLGTALVVASLLVRRRTAAGIRNARRAVIGAGREDPAELERQARAAEQAGDYTGAVRLRFRAGVLRLDDAGVLKYRPSLTTRSVTRRAHSATLVDLGRTFDEIVYGGRAARPDDAAAAADGWPRALAEAGATK